MIDLKTLSKCAMAGYCRFSDNGKHCNAYDEIAEDCPYLNAINEIALLSMELIDTYMKDDDEYE